MKAPITGITGAAAEAGGEVAATGAEGFTFGVGVVKFVGLGERVATVSDFLTVGT